MSIGNKIRQIRVEKNIKQEELAQYLKMSQSTLSKIENESLAISVPDLLKVADYTHTPIENFLPDRVNINVQNNHDHAKGIFIAKNDTNELLEKRISDLEAWIKDLRERNIELQEKIKRKDAKIEQLKK